MLYRARRRRGDAPRRVLFQRCSGTWRDAVNGRWRQTLFVANELYFLAARGDFFAPARPARAPGRADWSYRKSAAAAAHHGKACTTICAVVCTLLDSGDAAWADDDDKRGSLCERFRGGLSAVEIQYREMTIMRKLIVSAIDI